MTVNPPVYFVRCVSTASGISMWDESGRESLQSECSA
jgi:hypothetical protein